MPSSILTIIFVLRWSRSSHRYAPYN